ncbi:MAG: helix-turn-helix transcriptional regulator [Flavobacteriales bacterium]|nr:helix-turn-helix transcriptional regulator [Flavobacteriales bacterium]
MIGNDFGNKLRQLRLDKGYSQEYMAELLEVSQKTYSNIENNKSPISVERLLKVIHEYQIDASVFLTEKSKATTLQTTTENHKKNTISFLSEELILQLKERIEEYKTIVHEKNRRIEFLENRLNT